MELAFYIKELLYVNDIIIIPGIGGFNTIYRAAEINSEDHTITPPNKILNFDKTLNAEDDFFVQQVALLRKTTKKNAEKFVRHQVDAFNKKLNKGETVLLEGIGYFSKDQEQLRFDRENETNFLTDSYGLSKIDYKPLDITLPPQLNSSRSFKYARLSTSAIIMVIAAIILVGGAITVYINFNDIKARFLPAKPVTKITVAHENNSPAPAPAPAIIEKKDTAKKSDLEKFFNNKTDKKTALAMDSVKEEVQPSGDRSYFIIGGSFKTFQRATIQASQYEKNGLKAEVLKFGEDLYRVSLGEFGEKDKAMAECERLKANRGMQDVWLLSK